MLAACLVMPVLISCYDDQDIWESIENLENRVEVLETSLNEQAAVLNDFMSGIGLTIKECVKNSDGSYKIVLSNDNSFVVYPEKNLASVVTYVEAGGVKYWATYDSDGNVVLLTDSNGDNIPVAPETTPVVKEKDGVYYLVIDGMEYVTGYKLGDALSMFSSYVVNKDESGNVHSITFTFGKDMSFTVTVDGYCGFVFVTGNFMIGTNPVSEYYVASGKTEQVQVERNGVVDYLAVAPTGWVLGEFYDEAMGTFAMTVSAPSEEQIKNGLAQAEGYIKVVAVLEGGKSSVAKLFVTTNPFKTFKIATSTAIVEMYPGIQKYAYGVCLYSDFNESEIIETATSLLQESTYPKGFGMSDTNISKQVSEIYGQEVSENEKYVFWAIPALFDINDEDNPYYYVPETLQFIEFGHSAVSIRQTDISYNDADILVQIAGVESYFGGTVENDENMIEDILYKVNNGIYTPYTSPMNYSGSAFGFPDEEANENVKISHNTKYATWVIPVSKSGAVYTEEDITIFEFTTNDITSGGAVNITAGDPTVGMSEVAVPLSAENASKIYYGVVTKKESTRYASDETRVKYLLENGVCVISTSAVAEIEDLHPSTEYTMFATAIDADGKFGNVLVKDFTTSSIVYNDLIVDVVLAENKVDGAVIKVNVQGGTATDYLYWVGETADGFWTRSTYLGGSRTTAQEYMYTHPDDANILRAMSSYPITSDGIIEISDFMGAKEYVIVVMAQTADGKYSMCDNLIWTTLESDLGTIVYKTQEEWTRVTPVVEFKQNSFAAASGMMTAKYGFNVSVDKSYTAYILAGSTSYFIPVGLSPEIISDRAYSKESVPDMILTIVNEVDKTRDVSWTPRDENGELIDNPNGGMINMYHYYAHGCPTHRGAVVYFAEGTTHEHCEQCQKQQAKLDRQKADPVKGPYCADEEIYIYINDGSPVYVFQGDAIGNVEIDKVFVVLKDMNGNFYEPYMFDLPNWF